MVKDGASEVLYSISQVNALTGVPKSTIRFWEREFKDFLVPLRTIGNQRRYDRNTVEMIEKINRLVNIEGYTLDGARRQIQSADRYGKPSDDNSDEKLNELAETMSDYLLRKMFEQVRTERRSAESTLEAIQ